MSITHILNKIAKQIVIVIVIGLIITALFWLWQRQPKNINQPEPQSKTATGAAQTSKAEDFIKNPKDNIVLGETKLKIFGKASPDSLVFIFANDLAQFTKVEKNGDFEKEVELVEGLNLLEIQEITSSQTNGKNQSLTIFVKKDETAQVVFAGPVKSIFDTVLTVSTSTGTKNVRTNKQTGFDIPKDEEEATASAIKNIRVGDFVIATGNQTAGKEDEIIASKIQILREEKPQNSRQITIAKILTNPRQNLISLKNQANQIGEYTLTKTTQVISDGKEAKSTTITKDKRAIIIYHKEDSQNQIDLIYLLP